MDTLKNMFKEVDKKTVITLVVGVVVLVTIIVIVALVAKLTQKNYFTYEKVEEELKLAAEKYYTDYNSFLPTAEGKTSSIDANTLVLNEYMKPLNELLKNGDSCTGNVVVTKLSTTYEYTPYLNCGTDYKSIELFNKILEDNKTVEEGVGLYSENNEKVFKGEVKNNFVMLNEQLWRIVRIDDNNNVVLLSQFRTLTFAWDNRYNEETGTNDGINNYNLSRIKESVENTYYNEELLTDAEKSKLVMSSWCLGVRNATETGDTKNVECVELSEEESPIGLLTLGEYMQASLDPNCQTVEDRGCTNYNYIHDMQNTFWSITKSPKSASHVYAISSSGISESRANSTKQVRYVIKLNKRALYESGSGTEEDPYKIR